MVEFAFLFAAMIRRNFVFFENFVIPKSFLAELMAYR